MDLTASAGVPIGADGHCIHLEGPAGGARECGLGLFRPFGCSVGMQSKGKFGHARCTVEYRVQE